MCILPLHSNATESVYCFVCHLFSKLIYWHKLNQTVLTLSLCFYTDGSRSRQFQLNKNILLAFCGLKLSRIPYDSETAQRHTQMIDATPSTFDQAALLHANVFPLVSIALLCNKTREQPTKRSRTTSELLSDASLMTCIDRRTKTAAHVLFLRQMSWRRDWNHHAKMLTVIFTGW